MTHQQKGNFAAKHPQDQAVEAKLANLIQEKAEDGRLSCAQAFELAEALKIAPAAVGRALDLLEVSIIRCQLGLFGYGPERKILKPAVAPPANVLAAIQEASKDAAITCAEVWQVAARQGVSKMEAAAVCETLKLKIRPCQLGAF